MIKRIPAILVGVLLSAGLIVLSYPSVSKILNRKYQINVIEDYDDRVAQMETQQKVQALEKAKKYNEALTGENIEDPFIPGSGIVLPDNYTSVLGDGNGPMGYIEIPKINLYLPIYHGAGDDVLQKGVGHLEKTAFPVGGAGNHPVLTGHTGMPGADMFTNLTDLKMEDVFNIHVLDEILAYKIDQILVVDPDDTSELKPIKNRDCVTLVTCTPYGVNSHRLLVRGIRTPYTPVPEKDSSQNNIKIPYNLILSIVAFIVTFLVIIIVRWKNRKSRIKG